MSKASELAELRMDIRDQQRFRVAPSKAGQKRIFVNCHYCGYTPPEDAVLTKPCPKCGGHTWERFAMHVKMVPAHMS